MTNDEYIVSPYEPHEHVFDPLRNICMHCGITAEAVYQGRDRLPTWEDVDEAYKDGRRIGIVIGEAAYKTRRRRKLVEVGFYICLRKLKADVGGL